MNTAPSERAAFDPRPLFFGHMACTMAMMAFVAVVAPVAGFHWRDPDAGGEQSIGWYRDAQASRGVERDSGRERILAYNEDDVRATRAVREWISRGF